MFSYLQSYAAGEELQHRKTKRIITALIAVIVLLLLAWFAYLFLHDYFETRTVKNFLAEVNAKDYKSAYRDWGCTEATPCPNYDFGRFLQDWGPEKKISSEWKVDSVDGCTTFVTVNVIASGAEVQSLGVERGAKTLMYAPAPECQERKWHWKQFFQRFTGHTS